MAPDDLHYSIEDLRELMARLRDPVDGCPWDLAQGFADIVPFTLEEAYELADAIERSQFDEVLSELGDLLFQVIFYARLAEEQGRFVFADVVDGIVRKLLRRHPHVFPAGTLHSRTGGQEADTDAIKREWERIKAEERGGRQQTGILDDVPLSLPALVRAAKLQKRAAQHGFDWDQASAVCAKVEEELAELKAAIAARQAQQAEQELGDLLFSCVNLARHLQVDAETALRGSNAKFERRFRFIEQKAKEAGRAVASVSLEELDSWWDEAKLQGL